MIKRLFVPERVKGYYLFPVRILGIDIGKTTIKATKLYCKGRAITVEKNFEEPIQVSTLDYQERASAALRIILEQAQPYDTLISALPSSQVIFKELKLPFIGLETIKKVVAYEVEPLLPFALADAVIDCIVTKEIPEEKSSEVLVAAVQNQYMAQHLALFDAAGASPDQVTIDLFAFYGLYCLIPAYVQQKGGVVLLEIEHQSTRMAYVYNGQLRFIRTLQKGLLDQSRLVANRLGISEQEAFEHIIRFGLEPDHNETYINAIRQEFTAFFNDIIFTLQSFATQAKPAQSITKIILFGTSASIKGLPQLITDLSHIKSELFSYNSLMHNNPAISTKGAIPQANLISFATALPISTTANFDLRQREFAVSEHKTIRQEFITALLLFTLILGSLLGTVIWQISKLKREAYQSEQEAIATIQEHIKNVPDDANTLDEVLETAQTNINQEEKTWSTFTDASRLRFLEYLLELTNRINKTNLGLDMERLTITPERIILKARVNGFDELRALEKDLNESKLFKAESVPDPNFTTTGMVITFKKPNRRGRP